MEKFSLLNQNSTYLTFLKIMFYSTSHSLQFNRYYLHFLIKNLDKIFLIRKHTSNELIPITLFKKIMIKKKKKKKSVLIVVARGHRPHFCAVVPGILWEFIDFFPLFHMTEQLFFCCELRISGYICTYIPSTRCGYLIRWRSDVWDGFGGSID